MDWLDMLRNMKAVSKKSTYEISLDSGIPEPTLEKIFSGKTKNPGINTVQILVHALGYTLDDLYPQKTKNDPAAAEAATGQKKEDLTVNLYNYLNQGLISFGFISETGDITDQEAEILISVVRILSATFDKR